MTEPDELYTLRNLFWNGCYQSAINESNGLRRVPPHLVVEKTEYLYRSYLALKQYDIVLGEISDEADTPQGIYWIRQMLLVRTIMYYNTQYPTHTHFFLFYHFIVILLFFSLV